MFRPAELTYSDSLWTKPVAILVDQGTASAAEEFAAVLQDNSAAFIVGSRTLGAGCGYTNGGTPTSLPHTGATLKVPDCVRFRADGSNEVNGVLPDVQIPWRRDDEHVQSSTPRSASSHAYSTVPIGPIRIDVPLIQR